MARILASRDGEGVFPLLDRLRDGILRVAVETLGARGGAIKSFVPKHSRGFQRLAAKIRLIRLVRREVLDRRESAAKPPSKAMVKLWHRLPDAYPDGSTLHGLGVSCRDAAWSRRAAAGLRTCARSADEELRQLRKAELRAATERRRKAAIDNFWSNGGLRRFLHPPSPSLHSPVMRAPVVSSVIVQGPPLVLSRLTSGRSGTELRWLGSERVAIHNPAQQQLVPLLEDIERSGLHILAFETETRYVLDRCDRIAMWERWLGEAAGATKQRCPNCRSQMLRHIPGLARHGAWWCCGCSHVVEPVVEEHEYATLPFPTATAPRIPAGATLRGPVELADIEFFLSGRGNGHAPGPDELPYELIRTAPMAFKQVLLDCLNQVLVSGSAPPADWLGGLVRFLPKPGGDLLDPGSYRPVCLQNTVYKVLSAVVNDRLYRLCERYGLLDPSQEGFRRLRSTQRQVQSLHWEIEAAAKKRAPLYVLYLDFENAFNSVDHAAVWRWLTELNVPDVELLRSLYQGAHYAADLPYGRSQPVYLTRGTKQGDILSPLLFNLIFNLLLFGLRQSGVGVRTIRGLRAPGRGFADDLTLLCSTEQGMETLVQVVAQFCRWSGMRVKLSKSVITGYDFGRRADLPTDHIRYGGESLPHLPAHRAFKYLGVRTALSKGRSAQGPCMAEEIEHVLSSTRSLREELVSHEKPLFLMLPAMRMVCAARFRYSAALVPWTDADLEKLFKIWMQVEKATWRLPPGFPSASFQLPVDSAGAPLEHPRVTLIQALATHVRQLVALPDELRESTIARYRRLCELCGCHNERELATLLSAEAKPRSCPIARLLRACGQMGIDIKLPDVLTAGKMAREVSWYALRVHMRSMVGSDMRLLEDLRCVERHWSHMLKRFRERGVFAPRQLLADRCADPIVWLLPSQLSRNPGWLAPLRRLLQTVRVHGLFPSLDRGEGAAEPPAHQELVSLLFRELRCDGPEQVLRDIFLDSRWRSVRSGALTCRWNEALRQEGLPVMQEGNVRNKAIIDHFVDLGAHGLPPRALLRLLQFLAPSLYTATPVDSVVNKAFGEFTPLSRDLVSFEAEPPREDSRVVRVGQHMLVTHRGLTRVTDLAGQHIATINQGRWAVLEAEYGAEYAIRALPVWLAQAKREDSTRGAPSLQFWKGIADAWQADIVIGCSPITAPAVFQSARDGRTGDGWGRSGVGARPVFNFLTLAGAESTSIIRQFQPDSQWLALTREKTLTAEAKTLLGRIGVAVYTWRKGALVVAGSGIWGKARMRSVQSREAWTIWADAASMRAGEAQLRSALQGISLSRDGTIPLDPSCPSLREARLGVSGSALTFPGIIIATDGAVKTDGRMGAAYVPLDPTIMRPRSFVVLGHPSTMRAELSALDAVVADAPLQTEVTMLTDSLASMEKLEALQRKDFPEWLHGHPERALLESVVTNINRRAAAGAMTRFVKVRAHAGHPLNEAADAAASSAAFAGDPEAAALCHADSAAVRFYVHDRLIEWGAAVRQRLIQVTAQQYQARLSHILTRQAEAQGADGPVRTKSVTLTAQWMMREDQGRHFLGAALRHMRNGTQKRRLMQTIAGFFPCQSLLFKWGKAASPQCLLCRSGNETVSHIQCMCTALKDARIAAHHTIAAHIVDTLRAHTRGKWHFYVETPVSQLRPIDVPLDMYDVWNRLIDAMEDIDPVEVSETDSHQVLARLRPDIWAVSWSARQVLLLELTRAGDHNPAWYVDTDESKRGRYRRLQMEMQAHLPTGWVVDTLPLTVGVRGSLHVPSWRKILDIFEVSSAMQDKFLETLTRQALEELDRIYGVRSEALRQVQNGPAR